MATMIKVSGPGGQDVGINADRITQVFQTTGGVTVCFGPNEQVGLNCSLEDLIKLIERAGRN